MFVIEKLPVKLKPGSSLDTTTGSKLPSTFKMLVSVGVAVTVSNVILLIPLVFAATELVYATLCNTFGPPVDSANSTASSRVS